MIKRARKILKNLYGYDSFRRGQETIIETILNRENILGVMTTGGGKSICYQIPALIFPDLTLVVSPLISLMKDQVDNLRQLGVETAFLNSSLSKEEYLKIIQKIKNRKIKILYLAPERLTNDYFIKMMEEIPISMLAVDEAHCISQWGHDFRKSYLEIPNFLEKIGQNPLIMSLTATATPKVREDIVDKLKLKNPKIYVDSFDRENITFKVRRNVGAESYIVDYIKANPKKPGIIYAATRKEVENLYSYLQIKGIKVGKYHAGLDEKEKNRFQDSFTRDEIDVMVATNAFGMGIDKSNVRYVIHRNIPKDLESYYQEAGRAGRDGAPAEAVLLFYEEDITTQEFLIEQNEESSDEVKKEKRKKLAKMADYAYLDSCYREFILKYFGNNMIKNYCGNCSNCREFKDVEILTLEAQKVLSCVGRAKETIGISTLTTILLGKIDDKIEKKEYHLLSTFGIMSNYKYDWLEEFIYYLIRESYLEQSAGSFPVLKLTNKGYSVLKNLKSVYRKSNETVTFEYFNNPIFERLNELRKKIAERESVAPYIVFSDLTLIEMAEKRPKNRWEMLKIRGVGNQKFKNYGESFLEIINSFENSKMPKIEENEYLTEERIKRLKKALNLDISQEKLKQILEESLFR